MGKIRHYFPGNNTPQGFFSYYRYIINQREAARILCIKGGPGTGKSTFFKKIGQNLEDAGLSVDYLHCSADEASLDGIFLPEKRIALIDGTSPHVIDPVTPGAVDSIINFGEFWNDKEIAETKEEIIKYNEACSRWYRIAYQYLQAARAVMDSMNMIQEEGLEVSEVYHLAADIITREFRQYDIALKAGHIKKFFASAITPGGIHNGIKDILPGIKKVYLINTPEGYANGHFMNVILEGAIYRGFDVEAYYCPMNPEDKLEHILIPQLSLAFVTTNRWHDLEPWEITDIEELEKEITLIDICDYQSYYFGETNKILLNQLSMHYEQMLEEAICSLSKAKENHDKVEELYVGSMNFKAVDQLAEEMTIEILG